MWPCLFVPCQAIAENIRNEAPCATCLNVLQVAPHAALTTAPCVRWRWHGAKEQKGQGLVHVRPYIRRRSCDHPSKMARATPRLAARPDGQANAPETCNRARCARSKRGSGRCCKDAGGQALRNGGSRPSPSEGIRLLGRIRGNAPRDGMHSPMRRIHGVCCAAHQVLPGCPSPNDCPWAARRPASSADQPQFLQVWRRLGGELKPGVEWKPRARPSWW